MTTRIIKKTQGTYFDLAQIFSELNSRFFYGKIEAELRWGNKRSPPPAAKHTIRLGSYHPLKRLITIHPCLDQAAVPGICVERILFHEMAHQIFPSKRSPSGKILVHYREFNDFEKNYPYLSEADRWIKTNLPRLLRF
jgi:hypothetical protein